MAGRSLISGRTYFAAIKQKTFSSGFFDEDCKEFYLRRLLRCQGSFRIELHAYLLMKTEILLVFTTHTPSGFDSFARFLNTSYSSYYAVRFARPILAWHNEPLVCCLPTDELVLDCQKFVERYAISISGRSHPGQYRYSSYCANAFAYKPMFLKSHSAVRALKGADTEGLRRYRAYIAEPFREEYERFLRSRLLFGQALLLRKPAMRLENHRALTDTEKNGTMPDRAIGE